MWIIPLTERKTVVQLILNMDNFVKTAYRHFWLTLSLITKGLLAFTLPVYVMGPSGVSYFDSDGDEDEESDGRSGGMCESCNQYECEC